MITASRSGGGPESVRGTEYALPVQDFLQLVRRRIWVIALTLVLVVGVVVGYTFIQTPVYEASIKILVGQKAGSDQPTTLGSDVQGLQELTQTMTLAVDTRPVAQGVIQELNLQESPDALLGNLSAEQVTGTQFIEVSYLNTSPEQAKRIVDAVGEEFTEQVSSVSPTTNAITATVWEPAVIPATPVSPDPLRNCFLALAIGGMLGVGLAFLLEYVDDSWRSPEEVEQITGIPAFGVIPVFEKRNVMEGR